MTAMRFASAITETTDPTAGVASLAERVLAQLGGKPDVAFLFVSSLDRVDWEPRLADLRARLGGPVLLGCTGSGVLGVDQELEFIPAMTLGAATLPEVAIHPFVVEPEALDLSPQPSQWIRRFGIPPEDRPISIVLPDPYSCDAHALLENLNTAYPRMPLIGGLAGAATQDADTSLFLNDRVVERGAVGLLLTGDIELVTVVSQGCRPVGLPHVITKGHDQVILELAGVPAAEALRQLLLSLPESDRALAVGDEIHVGQTVQFQLRDADTSRDDLRHLVTERAPVFREAPSSGGLLFSCLGRDRTSSPGGILLQR